MEKRSLTKDEIKYLKRYFGKSPNDFHAVILNAIFGCTILTTLVFVILYSVTKYVLLPILDVTWTENYKTNIFIISVLIAFLIAMPMAHSFFDFKRKTTNKLKKILETNQAEVFDLSILRAAELEENEDEGVGFLLETNDRRVLFVRGQDLYDYASDFENEEDLKIIKPYGEYFPSTKLTFIRESTIGIRLNLTAKGDKINNVIKLKRKNFIRRNKGETKYIGPEDGSFYDGNIEDVLKRFSISL